MPLDPRTTAWLDQEDAHLARVIRQHRWAVQCVGSGEEDDEPSFGYTIGLFGLGHPELVLVGLDADTTHGALQRVAEEVATGRDLVPGELLGWEDREGRLCVEASPNPGEVVLGANRSYQRPPEYSVPAFQLAWRHADGSSPGRRATRAGRRASRAPAPGGRDRERAGTAVLQGPAARPIPGRPRPVTSLRACER